LIDVVKLVVRELVMFAPAKSKQVGAVSNAMKHAPTTVPAAFGNGKMRVALFEIARGLVHPVHGLPVAASIQIADA
jgi:hypothetical protein